jgi:hypothetical protein
MPLVGLVSRYTLYLSSGENGLSHEPAYHQGSGAGEFLRVVLYAEQMILRISAGRLVVDRLDGDHASGMPNLERGGDRRPILCRDQERCPASLSLTAPLSSRSIRQPTADRLIVVAFLHISSIGPNQKLHAHPLHPSIHPSFQPRLPTPGFKSSVCPAVNPAPISSVTVQASDRGGSRPARLLSSTVYCRTSGRAGSFLTTRYERLTSSPTGRR